VDNGATPDIFTASGLGMVGEVRKLLDKADESKQVQLPVMTNQSPQENIYSIAFNTRRKGPGGYYQGFGVTPLHWAARGGSVEVAALLVSRGASVTAKDSRGETALFWAASEGRLDTAKFLVEHGANLNATNTFGSTPLLTAARETVSPSLIKFMIAAGADINARDTEGENALHKLAWFGCPEENIETARMLIDAGADVNARNNDGKTPLEVLLNNSLRNENLVQLYRKHAGNKPSKL
jgi:ankyrin repeat protein